MPLIQRDEYSPLQPLQLIDNESSHDAAVSIITDKTAIAAAAVNTAAGGVDNDLDTRDVGQYREVYHCHSEFR